MAALTYVGRNPASDADVVPKSYADSQNATLTLTTSIVSNIINTAAATLAMNSFVDAGDAALIQKTSVDSADALCVAAAALGAANGVAKLDSGGSLPLLQSPAGVLTDRIAKCYSLAQSGTLPLLGGTTSATGGAIGTQLLTPGNFHTVSTTTLREYQLATITVPDPGYPWRPLPFAWVQGNSSSGTIPGSRSQGNGDFGVLTCMPPSGVSDTVYGVGICTASYFTDTYPLIPYAAASQTALSVPPITGSLELDLWGCCWSGVSYTFAGTNLTFFILVVPSL